MICSGAAQVGVIHLRLDSRRRHRTALQPCPAAGLSRRRSGSASRLSCTVDVLIKVRTGGDYGVDAESLDSSTGAGLEGSTVEVWGVPATPSHDPERICGKVHGCSVNAPLVPYLTNPTSCTGPMTETIHANSWQAPSDFVNASTTLPAMTGCSAVPFTPEVVGRADEQHVADSPTGLTRTVRCPHDESPAGSRTGASSSRRSSRCRRGMTVSPSAANGLEACSPEQIGLNNRKRAVRARTASKLGTVEIETPAAAGHRRRARVYLAQQNQNPFGSMLAIYLVAQADGALIKLAGHVELGPATGQLTTYVRRNAAVAVQLAEA